MRHDRHYPYDADWQSVACDAPRCSNCYARDAALAPFKVPAGATGAQIDAAARIDLWAHGLDFGHGTGHGVGYVLNVHEGPVAISPRAQPVAIQPGNVLSDEPGVYRPGRWGIRVENLMVCEQEQTTEFENFLSSVR